MSARSRLKVLVCSECGKQRAPKEQVWAAFHRHGEELKPYEEVEVIPVADFEGFKERLIHQGAEVLAQRAYETVMCDLPLVTPRWDQADPKVRAAFIARARGDLAHFVIPAIEEAASENPEPRTACTCGHPRPESTWGHTGDCPFRNGVKNPERTEEGTPNG